MSGISAEWEVALAAIKSRQQKPTYMVSALLAAITHFSNSGCPAKGPLPIEKLLANQSELLARAGCSASKEAWQGIFHLSGTAVVWSLFAAELEATFDDMPRRKPRSAKQLLERADSVRFSKLLIPQLLSKTGRADLAAKLKEHLLTTSDTDDHDSRKLAAVVMEPF